MLRDFSKDRFDIIIQAGQSNSEGTGKGEADRPFNADWEVNPNVLYLNSDFTISAASERVWGNSPIGDFSLAFARNYIEENRLEPGRKLLIIRAAVGGTGFSDERWGEGRDLDSRMMEMIDTAASLNPQNRFVCFLWHQGETDVLAGASSGNHRGNLGDLLKRVRTKAGDITLPFVTADFVPLWKNKTENAANISEAIRAVCNEAGNGAFVSSDGLKSNEEAGFEGDDIHFCRQSLYELGERMYKAFKLLQK